MSESKIVTLELGDIVTINWNIVGINYYTVVKSNNPFEPTTYYLENHDGVFLAFNASFCKSLEELTRTIISVRDVEKRLTFEVARPITNVGETVVTDEEELQLGDTVLCEFTFSGKFEFTVIKDENYSPCGIYRLKSADGMGAFASYNCKTLDELDKIMREYKDWTYTVIHK
jgi:hypothetical protein